LDLETSAVEEQASVSAFRVKVTGTETVVIPVPNEDTKDFRGVVEAIKAKVAEAVYRKPPRIVVAVTAIEISRAVADHLKSQRPFGRKQITEGLVVPQSLTLVVNDAPVFRTSKPLSCERHAFMTVVERMSGVKLKELLCSGSSFVIYNQVVKNCGHGCRSYDKIKDSGEERVKQNGSRRNERDKSETKRLSQAGIFSFVGRR
jgi:hypothetical protein